jgi:membrane associated rhomboid family serine protease
MEREPITNVPRVVLVLLGAFVVVHIVLWFVLSTEQATDALLLFSFIPARYDPTVVPGGVFPGGVLADVWTFVSYAFIHANLNHLFFNSVWFLAFGTPVARRFGPVRFLALFILTAAAGATVHLATHPGELLPVVGASAAISGMMAAAMRFVFQAGGPLGLLRLSRGTDTYRVPAAPLWDNIRDRRVIVFLVVWFGTNLLFGVFGLWISGIEQAVAWEAHIGGFVAGLLAFSLLDPVSRYVGSSEEHPPAA